MAQKFSKSFYNSKEWTTVRETIMMRDCYLCTMCGNPAEEVHHIKKLTPRNIGDRNISLNPDNLTSLCKDCHFKQHTKDKADGHRKAKGDSCGEEYTFDSNGMLIKK